MKTVGERVRQAREAKKMTGADLAKAVGYKHQSSIGNIEGRASGQGGKRLPDIARALRVPIIWLLEGPDTDTVPFIESLESVNPIKSTTYEAREPTPAYTIDDGSMREGIDMFRQLDTGQRLEVILLMRRLLGRPDTAEGPDSHRDPLSDQEAA